MQSHDDSRFDALIIYCGVPDPPCLSKMPFVMPDVLYIMVDPLVRARAAAFNGDPASLACDNI